MRVPVKALLLVALLAVVAVVAVAAWRLGGLKGASAPGVARAPGALSGSDPSALPSESHGSKSEGRQPSQPSAADSALLELRRGGLSLPTRRAASLEIAVSGDRVIRVIENAVQIRDAPNGGDKEIGLDGAFAVAALPFGGMLALGRDKMLVFDEAARPRELPRPTVLPGSKLLPDLSDAAKIWVWHQGGNALYGYDLLGGGEGLLAPQRTVTLQEFDGNVLLPLRDGSLVYSQAGELSRLFVGGRPRVLSPLYGGAPMIRGLLARRVDELMILYEDGTLERLHLQNRLRRRALHRFETLPVDIVSTGHGVAALFANQRAGAPRRWSLRCFTLEFSLIDEIELPGGATSPGSSWLSEETRNRLLAAHGRWIALGGPRELSVWDFRALKQKRSQGRGD